MKNQKLNILYILTKLELGGAQKVCLTLFNGVQETGNNAFLITGSEGILRDKVKAKNNVILLKTFKREVSIKYFLTEFVNFVNLVKEIKKLKLKNQNLQVHTHSTKAGIIGRWAAFFAGVKIRIHTIHGFALHKHQNKLIWIFIYLAEFFTSLITTKFICVSSKDIELGKKLFPNFKKKCHLIRAGVQMDKFIIAKHNNVENIKFVFGTISCFKKQKNLIDLFKAFEKVTKVNPDCILEVIGDGSLRAELEYFIKEKNLKEKIILHGWQDNVNVFMAHWDTFVLSSLWEGLPCAIIEARLQKLPVIAYDTGGICDVIQSGKNGILCKQGDWQSLSDEMINISKNQTLYKDLKNFNENLSDFNNNNMIKKHIDLYKSLYYC